MRIAYLLSKKVKPLKDNLLKNPCKNTRTKTRQWHKIYYIKSSDRTITWKIEVWCADIILQLKTNIQVCAYFIQLDESKAVDSQQYKNFLINTFALTRSFLKCCTRVYDMYSIFEHYLEKKIYYKNGQNLFKI